MNKLLLTFLIIFTVSFAVTAQDKDDGPPPPPVKKAEPQPLAPPAAKPEEKQATPAEPCRTNYADMPDIYSLRLGMQIADVKKLYPHMSVADLAKEIPQAKNLEHLKIKLALAGDDDLKPLGHSKDTNFVSFFFVNDKLLGIVGLLKYDRQIATRREAAKRISDRLGLPSNWRPSTIIGDNALQMDCGDFSLIADRYDRSPMFMILSLEMVNDEIVELLNLRNST